MFAVICVPFFDTPENDRAEKGTIACLTHLLENIRPPHVVIPVDNGSTDKRGSDFAMANFEHFIEIEHPLSISEGVNSGWHLFHDALMAGDAIAIKHDSDLVTSPDNWVDKIVTFFESDPDIYLVGPRHFNVNYSTHRIVTRDYGHYYDCSFLFGGVQARSTECFKRIGYARQPYGKWGFGDHWDSWRVKYLKKRIVTLKNVVFDELVGHSALSEEEKKQHQERARQSLMKLQRRVSSGAIDIYQEFTGCLL